MGKKDGKRVDKVKVEAKKAKQAAKQVKIVKKSVKKEIKELGEDDIEMMIAEVCTVLTAVLECSGNSVNTWHVHTV